MLKHLVAIHTLEEMEMHFYKCADYPGDLYISAEMEGATPFYYIPSRDKGFFADGGKSEGLTAVCKKIYNKIINTCN